MPTAYPQYDIVRDQAALAVRLVAMTTPGCRQLRFRYNVNDPYPVTLWFIPGEGEQGITTLRDYRLTGIDTVKVCVPRQPGLELNQPLPPGPVVEIDIGSDRWYSVDVVDYCCSTPSQAPMYTFTCSFGYEDAAPTT